MIFVTVGTTGFDDLVKHVDHIAVTETEEFIIQIGPGTYLPQNCQYFRYEPSLEAYYEHAEVIISHGGLATVSEVLVTGRSLVAVEDQSQPDRHQREILSAWEAEGYLLWCKTIESLTTCITAAKSISFTRYTLPSCDIPNVIQRYIDNLITDK